MSQIYHLINDPDKMFQLELLLRAVVASGLGCVIGYERKNRDKSAGMRTHAIVCLGAALIMIVSKYCFYDVADYDASRVAAQIVSGVGFLGTGMIFIKNSIVSGLTTAAGVWTTAGVGMAIGAGAYFLGISVGLLIVLIQILLHRISFLFSEPIRSYIKITTSEYESVMTDIQEEFCCAKIKLINYKVSKAKTNVKIEFTLAFHSNEDKNAFVLRWSKDSRIHAISG